MGASRAPFFCVLSMRVPSFLTAVLWVSTATGSEPPPTCKALEDAFGALPVSSTELSAALASDGRAESCRFDAAAGGAHIECDNIHLTGISADRVSVGEVVVWEGLAGTRFSVGRLERGANRWLASAIVWHTWEISSVRRDATGCVLEGVRGHGLAIDAVTADGPQDVSVDGMPTFIHAWETVSPGFLPPAFRFAEVVEAEASGVVWRNLGVVGFGGDHTLGGGLIWVTDDAAVASLTAVNEGDAWKPAVTGEVALARASAHLELAPQTTAALRAMDWGALARDYRVTQAGASLRGDEHALSVGAGSSVWGSFQTREANLEFGADAVVGGVRIDADVRHASRWVEDPLDTKSVHGSLVGVRVVRPFGLPAFQVAPAVDAFMTYGLLPSDEGLDASTTASVHPSLLAEVIARGRFSDWWHRVGVRGRAAVEVYGFTQRAPSRPRSLAYLWDREDGAALAQVELVNAFEGRTWSIDVPVGISYRQPSNEWRPTVRSELSWGPWRVTARAACGSGCDAYAFDANVEARWPAFGLAAGVADGELEGLWATQRSIWADLWRGQTTADERVWMARIGWQPWTVANAEARVFSAPSRQGGLLWLAFAPRLGFEVGAGLGVETRRQEATGTVGLRVNN